MPSRVGVQVTSPSGGRRVDADLVGGVRYAAAAPRGFTTCSFTLSRPLRLLPADAEPFVDVTVTDRVTAEVLWNGWIEVPGRGNDRGIELYDVVAVGGAAHAFDNEQPLIYVDGRWSEWERVDDFGAGAAAQLDSTGGASEAPGLRMFFPRGTVLAANGRLTVRYPHLVPAGQRVGRLAAVWVAGTAPTYQQQFVVRTAALAGVNAAAQTWSLSTQTLVARLGTEIPASSNYQFGDYRAIIPGGGTVSNDVNYSLTSLLRIIASRYTQAGAELVTAADYPINTVLPHQVVADLLGRPGLLPLYDGAGASIAAASTVAIEQLAYESGVQPGQVLADLMDIDPAFYWAVWERGPTGRYRFEWATWPTTPTVYADARVTFSAPSSTADLIDTVRVLWKDQRGAKRWSTYTRPNALLTAARRSRSRTVDLGSEAGSQGQADAAGAAALDAGQAPRNNGRCVIRTPVLDILTGRSVAPRELPRLAGRLMRLPGVEGRQDALNPSDRDGVSVFRMAEVEYDDGAGEATVTLDSYEGSVVAALGRLSKQTTRVRRP